MTSSVPNKSRQGCWGLGPHSRDAALWGVAGTQMPGHGSVSDARRRRCLNKWSFYWHDEIRLGSSRDTAHVMNAIAAQHVLQPEIGPGWPPQARGCGGIRFGRRRDTWNKRGLVSGVGGDRRAATPDSAAFHGRRGGSRSHRSLVYMRS